MSRLLIAAIVIAATSLAGAQSPSAPDRTRAREQNRLGWDYMKGEQFENAVKAFQMSAQ